MGNISSRAMLITLTQRAWKGKATDRTVAAQAEVQHGAEVGTMTVVKALTPKHLIQPINTIMTLGRSEHYRMTLPGLIKGQHLLPTAMFETYMMTQRTIRDQFFEAVEKYIAVYPSIRDQAAQRFGSAYKPSDFPSVTSIRSYFDYSFTPAPVPDVKDWRLDVDDVDAEAIREEVTASVRDMYAEATKDVFDQCKGWLEKIESQTKTWTPKAPGATMRDAFFNNLNDFISIVGGLNVTGDPKLDIIINEMQQFANLDGAALRRDEEHRKGVMEAAHKALSKLSEKKRRAA